MALTSQAHMFSMFAEPFQSFPLPPGENLESSSCLTKLTSPCVSCFTPSCSFAKLLSLGAFVLTFPSAPAPFLHGSPLLHLGLCPRLLPKPPLSVPPAHQLCPRTFRLPHQTIGTTVGLLTWEAEGDRGDLAQVLTSRLWRFLEAVKVVLGGGPSPEAGVGTGKQNPSHSHTPHHTSSARLGRQLGGARQRSSFPSSVFWQIGRMNLSVD